MDKIVIIGSPGAGKSTLARYLGRILHINVIYLDRLFWRSDWVRKSRDTRIDILQNLVLEKQWIIDGDYLNTSELHLETANIVIFLGISPLICLKRIVSRHLTFDGHTRRDMPMGSKDKLTLLLILKVLLYPFVDKRMFKQKLINYTYNGKHKQVIWLRSSTDVEDFLAQQKAQVNKEKQSSITPFILKTDN